jgi:hypothetical protein
LLYLIVRQKVNLDLIMCSQLLLKYYETGSMKLSPGAAKEKIGRWWAVPTTASFLALQTVAYELFGENEQLYHDITSAPVISFAAAVAIGWTANKCKLPPEIARYAVPAFTTLGASAIALAAQDRLHFDGIQSGVAAMPAGELAVVLETAAVAGLCGEATGRALAGPARQPAPAVA